MEDKGGQVQRLTVWAAAACVGAEGGERKVPGLSGLDFNPHVFLDHQVLLAGPGLLFEHGAAGHDHPNGGGAGVVNVHAHGASVVVAVAHNGLNLHASVVCGVVEAVGAGIKSHV